jgi:hypothetical protein
MARTDSSHESEPGIPPSGKISLKKDEGSIRYTIAPGPPQWGCLAASTGFLAMLLLARLVPGKRDLYAGGTPPSVILVFIYLCIPVLIIAYQMLKTMNEFTEILITPVAIETSIRYGGSSRTVQSIPLATLSSISWTKEHDDIRTKDGGIIQIKGAFGYMEVGENLDYNEMQWLHRSLLGSIRTMAEGRDDLA